MLQTAIDVYTAGQRARGGTAADPAEDRVRGYAIPDPVMMDYLLSNYPLWSDTVIPDSIFLVRKGDDRRQFVVFNTTRPLQRIAGSNIGRVTDVGAETYKGFAMPVGAAAELGMYDAGTAAAIAPSDATIAEEHKRAKAAALYSKQERRKEAFRAERMFADDLAAGVGDVGAWITNTAGRVLGKTVGGFLFGLGPYGVVAISVVGLVGLLYLTPTIRAALAVVPKKG